MGAGCWLEHAEGDTGGDRGGLDRGAGRAYCQ